MEETTFQKMVCACIFPHVNKTKRAYFRDQYRLVRVICIRVRSGGDLQWAVFFQFRFLVLFFHSTSFHIKRMVCAFISPASVIRRHRNLFRDQYRLIRVICIRVRSGGDLQWVMFFQFRFLILFFHSASLHMKRKVVKQWHLEIHFSQC